jgi:hypothetical protein
MEGSGKWKQSGHVMALMLMSVSVSVSEVVAASFLSSASSDPSFPASPQLLPLDHTRTAGGTKKCILGVVFAKETERWRRNVSEMFIIISFFFFNSLNL